MKLFSRIISVIFHPLFVPLYLALIITSYAPTHFVDLKGKHYTIVMSMLAILMIGFPLFAMLVMRGLGMIQSFNIKDVKERFIPMIAVATFYLWTYMMFKPTSKTVFAVDPILSSMIMGSIVSIFLAFFFNSFYKISLHAIAAGGIVGVVMNVMPVADYNMTYVLIASLVIAGAVATARLYLQEHTPKEVYMGLLAGYFAQFFAYQIWA